VDATSDRKVAPLSRVTYGAKRQRRLRSAICHTHLGDSAAHGTRDVVWIVPGREVETGNAVVGIGDNAVDAFLADGVRAEEKTRLLEQVETHGAYEVLRRPEIFVQVELLQVNMCIHILDTRRSYVTLQRS